MEEKEEKQKAENKNYNSACVCYDFYMWYY